MKSNVNSGEREGNEGSHDVRANDLERRVLGKNTLALYINCIT